MVPQNWADDHTRRIAAEIRRLRKNQGRSAQWLADRTAEFGYAVTRPIISDLEIGRRKYITTAELIVLAAALETAPIALLFPAPLNEKVWALPRLAMPKFAAAEEFCGGEEAGLASPENLRALQRARDIADARNSQQALLRLLEELQQKPERLGYDDPAKATKTVSIELAKVTQRIAELEGQGDGR